MDAASPHTMVFYESPFRIEKLLHEASDVFGDRRAAVCLELTKKFERVSRGTLSQLLAEFTDKKIKGEAVIVIEGNRSNAALQFGDPNDENDAELQSGVTDE
jgi:16S rRNA (cytidine1402-2'-O)-methyltransferase